jgi:hypothetical protein
MSSEALGGGVMVAVAAALWVAYLMPTWSRRRQYLATERNAVRLQQTLRILAETAEVPAPVRLEANARAVAAQRKILTQAEDDARAAAKAVADAARRARREAAADAAAMAAASRPPVVATPALALRRLRKRRASTSLVLLAGLIAAFAGVVPAAAGSWYILSAGATAALVALAALSRLARTARALRVARSVPVARAQQVEPTQKAEHVPLKDAAVATPTWTPQPLPRPLYLSRGSVAQTAMASVDAAAELRKATAQAELALRFDELAAEAAAAVTPITRPTFIRADGTAPASSAAPSRFASMGIVEEAGPGMSDLDAVLRRRRAV